MPPYGPCNAFSTIDRDSVESFKKLCITSKTEEEYSKFTAYLCRPLKVNHALLCEKITAYRIERLKLLKEEDRKDKDIAVRISNLEQELLEELEKLPEAVEFDGCKGATALMKLESLQKDSLIPTELTHFILEKLEEYSDKTAVVCALIHKKEKLTIGCDAAARSRGIPPFQEMKSIFYEIKLKDGGKEYLALHIRGDEEVEESSIKEIIKTKFAGADSYKKANVEEFGLSTGRVNPLSLEYIKGCISGMVLKQCFSKSLFEPANKDFPRELFTNIGSNYLGMTVPIKLLDKIISSIGGCKEDFAKVRGVAERKSYDLKTIGFIGDSQSLFKSIMITMIQRQICDELGASFPPLCGNIPKSGSDYFCNFTRNPEYYGKEIKKSLISQFYSCAYEGKTRREDLICVGHTAKILLPGEVIESFEGTLLSIDECTVGDIKSNDHYGTKKVVLLCGDNYKKYFLTASAYKDIAVAETIVLAETDGVISKIFSGSFSLTQAELDKLLKDMTAIVKSRPCILVIASAEIGSAIKQLPGLDKVLRDNGCELINSVDSLAKAACKIIYEDVLKETRDRKAAKEGIKEEVSLSSPAVTLSAAVAAQFVPDDLLETAV
jgi:hypothetical protein